MKKFIGRPAPDFFVMGLALWDVVFGISHEETLAQYTRGLIELKKVMLKLWKIKMGKA
jgi:hypothetical protein